MAREDLSYVEITEFYPYLVTELNDCPTGLRKQVLRETLVYFQTHSQFWRCQLYPINIVANKARYDLEDVPSYAEVLRPYLVKKDNVELKPELDYTMYSRNELELTTTPAVASSQGLKVWVVLKNTYDADRTWIRIFEDYRYTISEGVLWRLTGMPGKTWTNLPLSVDHKREFWDGINRARAEVNRQNMNLDLNATKKGFV